MKEEKRESQRHRSGQREADRQTDRQTEARLLPALLVGQNSGAMKFRFVLLPLTPHWVSATTD